MSSPGDDGYCTQGRVSGQFPVRAYMYNLRTFTRVKKVPGKEIDTFVQAVAGKSLSTRDIETLAYGYFHGGGAI